jgi:TRIAD3 protein (E3 ubiquitin-protein ligase RNF216)
MRHIERIVDEKKTLFDAYIVIKNQLRTYNTIRTAFSKVGRPRTKKGYEDILAASGNDMPKELRAAQKKLEFDDLERRKEEEFKAAEEANLLQAQINGEMNDCQCCFDEFPFNRMVSCGGNAVHLFCRTCAKTYVEGEIGVSKCRPVCFADRDCGGTFSRAQLLEFLPQTSFDRLEHLQQQEDLRTAGLDFLEECPFCDFKAECLPADVDKEFRCENPKCGKTSCRLCQKETHIPMSCEEAKKDESLNVRHTVEEAKSAALIRHCNRCKNAFVKLDGCNKMTCTKCRNTQCYVCSKNVTNYDHFGNGRNRCPLHDNHEARHEQEVEKAEQEALAKIRAERPDISEEHLKIEVSDRVKQAEQSRLNQAQAQHQNFPFHMNGDQLVAGHIPPPPPPPLPPAQPYPVGLRPPPPQLGNQGIVNFAQAFRPRGFHFFPRPLMLGGGLLPPAPDFGAHAVYRFGNAAHLAGFEQHVAWEELLNLGGQEQPNPMREEPPNLMGQGRVVGAARDPPHGRR